MERCKYSLRLVLLLTSCLAFSGCASLFQKKEGEYDFFLENKNGKKIESTEVDKKTKGAKEAKLRAKAALQQGERETALLYFVKALEHDDDDVEALNGIANIHFLQGNNELAVLAFRMILAEDEEDLDARQGLGLALIAANKYAQAREILLNSLADNPQRAKIYNGLAVISDLQNYPDEAKWFYNQALLIEPNSAIILNNLAYSFYLQQEWQQAENIYQKVINNHSRHTQAYLNYGLLKARTGELFDALTLFEQVLDTPQAYNELGYILMLDKKYTMAEQLFQKAISASPSYFHKAHDNVERLRELKIKRESQQNKLSAR